MQVTLRYADEHTETLEIPDAPSGRSPLVIVVSTETPPRVLTFHHTSTGQASVAEQEEAFLQGRTFELIEPGVYAEVLPPELQGTPPPSPAT